MQSSEDETAEQQHRSLSFCKYFTREDGDCTAIGDCNLVIAPLYHWWERLQQKYRETDERDSTEQTTWYQLGSCASVSKPRCLRRETETHPDNSSIIGILIKNLSV